MRRCPECRRDYHDDSLSFCLADGSELVYGLGNDEPKKAILHDTAPPVEAATPAQIHTTEAEPPDGFAGFSERQSLSAHRAAEPLKSCYLATFAAELGDKDIAFALPDKGFDKYDQFNFSQRSIPRWDRFEATRGMENS